MVLKNFILDEEGKWIMKPPIYQAGLYVICVCVPTIQWLHMEFIWLLRSMQDYIVTETHHLDLF